MILSPHKTITTPKSEVVIVILAAWNFRPARGLVGIIFNCNNCNCNAFSNASAEFLFILFSLTVVACALINNDVTTFCPDT